MLQCALQVRRISRSSNIEFLKRRDQVKRPYTSANREKIVFGIDYGSTLAKVSVYDRKTARPSLLLNREDGNVPYWHTAVAYDKISKKLVTGKKAKELAREDNGSAAIKVKKLLGTRPGHPHFEAWVAENNPQAVLVEPKNQWGQEETDMAWDLDKANKVVVALNSVHGRTFSATELAATTFESIKRVMQEYQAKNGGDGKSIPEAYLVVPADFNESQRASIVLAARRGGINVLKLIEEPIAALHGVRRLENFGWYSITDFGDTLKHYVVRVFDGEPDIYEASYIEFPKVLPRVERSFYDYLVTQLPITKAMRPWKNQLVKIFDAARDHLMDFSEYVIPEESSWMKRTLPYISREARALATFYTMRHAGITEPLLAAVSKTLPPSSITHPVLIGGNSLAYPEISNVIEQAFGTRLADTITDPTGTLALGAAMKAAEDFGLVQSILRGRDSTSFGYPILASSYADSLHHHLHMSKHHVPLPSTLNFSTIATYDKFEPLLPAFHEEQLFPENQEVPYPALSYGLLRDPYSGELEHWARVSIQVPRPPPLQATIAERVIEKRPKIAREMLVQDPTPQWLIEELLLEGEPNLEDVQPDLTLCFGLNLTASPLFDTARNVQYHQPLTEDEIIARSQLSTATTIPALQQVFDANPDRPSYKKVDDHVLLPELRQPFEENLIDVLEKMQRQKDSHSGFYRIQNRAHDMIQTILNNLRPNDQHALVATGGMAPTPLLPSTTPRMGNAFRLSEFKSMKKGPPTELLEAAATADCTGRSSMKYVDAVNMAYEMLQEQQEKAKNDVESQLKCDLQVMRDAMNKLYGPDGQPKEVPPLILTDDPNDLPQMYDGGGEDPADWMYPGISPGLLHDYYIMYQALKYTERPEFDKEYSEIVKALPEEERAAASHKFFEEGIASIVAYSDPGDLTREQKLEQLIETLGHMTFLRELIERMDARKTLKRHLGRQYRMVIIVDSPPDAAYLKDLESTLQRAARDNISATFLSIDGSPFDGPFMQMIARVKGAKTLRLYKKHLWNSQFLKEFGTEAPNAWHQSFSEPAVRNLALKVDFPGYTIDKVYGGWMTNEEKARLEMQRTTSTIRFKVGSLEPSYDIIPGPTPLTPQPTAMLIKLKPKPGANDLQRATDPDWLYNPESTTTSKSLVVGSRVKPSAHTPVSFDITWNDRFGTKKNRTHTLRLTDFNAPAEYTDEPGIAKLVRVAKFVEVMRKVLHQPFQSQLSVFDSDTPAFEVDTEKTGIQFIPQKQENELVRVYDEAKQSVIRIANERLLKYDYEGPIPKQYHELVKLTAHLLDWNAARHQGASFLRNGYNTDIVSRLMRSYMKASGISPVSLYARWQAMLSSTLDSVAIAALENPNSQVDTETLLNAPTLATLKDEKFKLSMPEPVYTPKFHGALLDMTERDPAIDIRNSYINANRMNALQMFPRDEMTPIHPTQLWTWNNVVSPESTFESVWNYIEPEHRDPNSLFYVEPTIDTRSYVKSVVGPHWKDYERLMDREDAMMDWYMRHPHVLVENAEQRQGTLSTMLALASADEKLFIEMLDLLARKVDQRDKLYEKNAILGARLTPLAEMRKYYLETIAPQQSPEEVARAKRIFKRLERKHAKSEASAKWESDQYDRWRQLLEEQQSYPSTMTGHILHLIQKVRQEDIDQATKNWATNELEAIEQSVIDSDSVLLKHLLENKDILNSVSPLLEEESTTDSDVLAELEKHLPADFLEKALSNVKRVTVTERGFHPSQVDEARKLGSEEEAWHAEAANVGEKAQAIVRSQPNEMIERQKQNLKILYAKLPKLVHKYQGSESQRDPFKHSPPLEVELGNVPIDWDDRFSRLKRKARAVIRARVEREDDTKAEVRDKIRKHLTQVAQDRVDHRMFLLYISKQESELRLQSSDLPYTDPEEYQRELARIKFDLSPNDYGMLVWAEYRRLAKDTLSQWEDYVTEGPDALIPFMPTLSSKLIDILERRRILSHTKARQYRDPIGYWFGDRKALGDDFLDYTIYTDNDRPLSAKEEFIRDIYEQQVAAAQERRKTGKSDVEPSETDFTVSTGDVVPTEAAAESEPVSETPVSHETAEVSETENPVETETASPSSNGEAAPSDQVPDDAEVAEDVSIEEAPFQPPKKIYTEYETIVKDPYTREDFDNDLNWHIYKMQTAIEPFPRDPAVLQEKRDEVSFDLVEFLKEDGTIDWHHVRTRRMQYPQTPRVTTRRIAGNDTYENKDNTNREMSPDDLSEREITKAEVEATVQYDLDGDEGFVGAQMTLSDMRLRLAKEARKKEIAAEEAAQYDQFDVSELLKAQQYNYLRDGWDRTRYEESMTKAYDLSRQMIVKADQTLARGLQKAETMEKDMQTRAAIEYAMMMPGNDVRGFWESWVSESKINREIRYGLPVATSDSKAMTHPSFWAKWMQWDRRAYEGIPFNQLTTVYTKIFGTEIPIWRTVWSNTMALDYPAPTFDRLNLQPPNPVHLFEPKGESLIYTKSAPRHLQPTELPVIARENKVFDDLKKFARQRYLHAVRKAYENFYGVANHSKNSFRSSLEAEREEELYSEALAVTGTTSRLVQPAKTSIQSVALNTPEERAAEAARIVRLSKQKSEMDSSASSSTPAPTTAKPVQDSLESLRSTLPGSIRTKTPQTLREKWEYAKQLALDDTIRKHALSNEKDSFQSWLEVQKKALKSRSLESEQSDAPTSDAPIVRYPEYEDVSARAGIFGLPGVNVKAILKEISKERRERKKKAIEALRQDLQKAYRDYVADSKRVQEALTELTETYDPLFRRRLNRALAPVIPETVPELASPDPALYEESEDDILSPIDLALFEQVKREMKLPGVDPDFWAKTDTKSRRQQRALNKLLTTGSPKAIEDWDAKMDAIHERKLELARQISERRDEINRKRLQMDLAAVVGPNVMLDLQRTTFFDPDPARTMVIQNLGSLDDRVKNPDAEWTSDWINSGHLDDLQEKRHPPWRTRLANMVEESLKAERAAAGLPEEDFSQESEHGHGH